MHHPIKLGKHPEMRFLRHECVNPSEPQRNASPLRSSPRWWRMCSPTCPASPSPCTLSTTTAPCCQTCSSSRPLAGSFGRTLSLAGSSCRPRSGTRLHTWWSPGIRPGKRLLCRPSPLWLLSPRGRQGRRELKRMAWLRQKHPMGSGQRLPSCLPRQPSGRGWSPPPSHTQS